MSKKHFRLSAVEALPQQRLRLHYADGQTFEVDLSDWIHTTVALAPLNDPALFAQARVGFGGHSVEWIEDELDLGADNQGQLPMRLTLAVETAAAHV